MPARAAASTWLRISASSGETITVGPGAPRAQQRGRDEVHRRLAPPGPLDHQRPPPLRDQGVDRRPLVVPQPRVLTREGPQMSLGCRAHFADGTGGRPAGRQLLVVRHGSTAITRRGVLAADSIGSVTDIVSIRDLRVSTVIGVYDWERETEQALTFSVDMAADVAKAASRDDLGTRSTTRRSRTRSSASSSRGSSGSSRRPPSASRSASSPTTGSPGSGSRSSSRSRARATRPRSPSSAGPTRPGWSDGVREISTRSEWS